jgi:hypothetical protein
MVIIRNKDKAIEKTKTYSHEKDHQDVNVCFLFPRGFNHGM